MTSHPTAGSPAHPSARRVDLDLRGLEPPEPMARILAALEAAQPETELVARLDRKPVFLLPRLQEAGYEFHVEDHGEDGWELRILR